MKKRIILAIAVACMFLAGYGTATLAFPAGGMYGRGEFRGYFSNVLDTNFDGDTVFPKYYTHNGRAEAFPDTINSAREFIDFIKYRQYDVDGNGTTPRERTGAAFIVQTMTYPQNAPNYDRSPDADDWAKWEAAIYSAEAEGRIQWRVNYSFRTNTYFLGKGNNGTPNDDAFYDNNDTDASMVFYNRSGTVAYALKWECANPVGNVQALPGGFNITGYTEVSDDTVTPNQNITFRHFLRNTGPSATSPTDVWWVGLNSANNQTTAGPGNSGEYAFNQLKPVGSESVTVPGTAQPGDQICRRVGWDPVNSLGVRNGRGIPRCATVVAQFSVTPQVQPEASLAVPGQTVRFFYRVTNSGPTSSPSVSCKVVGANRPAGYTPLPQQDADRASSPAAYPVPPTSCPRTFPLGTTDLLTEDVVIGNEPVGSLVCRSLVVNPRDHNSTGFRSSAEACVRIAKKPYTHFLGNDVWAGGNFPDIAPTCTGASNITTEAAQQSDGSVAGSVSEYGVFALGRITNFGSAGVALLNPASATGKQMTFANTDPNPSNLGLYGSAQHCINDYLTRFANTNVTAEPTTVNVANYGSGVWRMNGNHTFNGVVPNGRTQVFIVQNGIVTIDQDLRYPGNYNNLSDIPSLVIISTCTTPATCSNPNSTQGHIRVNDTVGQMDGLFIAKNVFNTCANIADPLDTGRCSGQLTVNGAVIAREMSLRRTHGADGLTPADRKRAAERFNFVPEMYLRSALSTGDTGTIETTITRELPPRF